MSRPSQNTDEKLIKTGLEMLEKSGLSRMNLRQVAAKAGVNLGMIHYHFKTKDQFIHAVLQDIYEKFFANFSLKVEEGTTPIEKLRQAIFAVAQFVRDNRRLLLSLIQDALDHNPEVKAFVQKNFGRHAKILLGLIRQCQANGSLVKINIAQVLVFLMPSVLGANLMMAALEHAQATLLMKAFIRGFGAPLLTDKAIQRRVDWALKSLSQGRG
jgi:AcrR family transcriptional regulator